jgi:hypothetical protein
MVLWQAPVASCNPNRACCTKQTLPAHRAFSSSGRRPAVAADDLRLFRGKSRTLEAGLLPNFPSLPKDR